MIEYASAAEKAAVLVTANNMCAAARTAPKAKGIDHIKACVVTGADKEAMADEMERLSGVLDYAFFLRDAKNVRVSEAVVVIGTTYGPRMLNDGCAYCGYKNCGECVQKHGICIYDPMDMGIAIGSAVSVAADARIDSRVMFSAGKAALSLGYLDKAVKIAMAIPLSAAGKSPFFDRKP